MIAVGGACGLQHILPGIAAVLDQPDRLCDLRRASTERHRGASAQAILHMHIENARRIGGDLLTAIEAEGSTVADVVIDAKYVLRKFCDEFGELRRRQVG